MKKLFRISNNPLESTFNDLKMFEQTQYCYEYIKKENPNVPDEEINDSTGVYEVDSINSYLLKDEDGKYYLCTKDGKKTAISTETAEILLNDGFNVLDEK